MLAFLRPRPAPCSRLEAEGRKPLLSVIEATLVVEAALGLQGQAERRRGGLDG